MIQMSRHPQLEISMPPRRDMEVSLHLIQQQTPKDPTAVPIPRLPPNLRRPRPFRGPPRTRNNIMHMLLPKPLIIIMILPPLPTHHPAIRISSQLMLLLRVHPLQPVRQLRLEHRPSQDSVARRVLHVDVDVRTAHRDHHVQIDLEVVSHALLDEECVVFVSAPPARKLAQREQRGDHEHRDRPFSSAGGLLDVLWFGFCCEERRKQMFSCVVYTLLVRTEETIDDRGNRRCRSLETHRKHQTLRLYFPSPRNCPRPSHDPQSRSSRAMCSISQAHQSSCKASLRDYLCSFAAVIFIFN